MSVALCSVLLPMQAVYWTHPPTNPAWQPFSRVELRVFRQPFVKFSYHQRTSIACHGNRLQQLRPASPSVDEVAEHLVVTLQRDATPQPFAAKNNQKDNATLESHVTQNLLEGDGSPQSKPTLPAYSSSPTVLERPTQQQQPQQLQQYDPQCEEWTFSPDESILSAADSPLQTQLLSLLNYNYTSNRRTPK